MVSGLVTSPLDQSRICSGDASEIRMALKLLTSSIVLLCHDRASRDRSGGRESSPPVGKPNGSAPGHPARGERRPAVKDGVVQSSNPARLIPPRSGSG